MRAQAIARSRLTGWKSRSLLAALAIAAALLAAAATFVSYMLWPTWPNAPIAVDAPAIPITVAGVIFNVPPAAIRAKVLRQPGRPRAHRSRLSVAFADAAAADAWPTNKRLPPSDAAAPPARAQRPPVRHHRRLGAMLSPAERLRSDLSALRRAQAIAGPDGLAILRLSCRHAVSGRGPGLSRRQSRSSSSPAVPGRTGVAPACACTSVARMRAASRCAFRANGWRIGATVAAGFDRLMAQLHAA